MRNKQIIFTIILPILFGALLYMTLAPTSRLFYSWIQIPKPYHFSIVPSWVFFNLPDGLWGMSLTSTLYLIQGNEITGKNYLLIFSGLIFGVCFEFLQLSKFINGTFDFLDILFIMVFSVLAIYINKLFTYRFNSQKILL